MKPLPKPTELTRPFWDGCRAGELRLQRCEACGDFRFFPSEACHSCGQAGSTWETVEGTAKVYSWIVVHRAVDPAWARDVPFAIVVGQLEIPGKPLVTGTLVGSDPGQVEAGMAITPGFEPVSDEISLLRWRAVPG